MKVNLRRLRKEDAPRMLEWMHDLHTTKRLLKNSDRFTYKDCIQFIEKSFVDEDSVHLGIDNVYQGTVSLKHILSNKSAEFAIVLHPDARGKGISDFALNNMIDYGFRKINLKFIYWSVQTDNTQAYRLYDRNGYRRSTLDIVYNKLGMYYRLYIGADEITHMVSCHKRSKNIIKEEMNKLI